MSLDAASPVFVFARWSILWLGEAPPHGIELQWLPFSTQRSRHLGEASRTSKRLVYESCEVGSGFVRPRPLHPLMRPQRH